MSFTPAILRAALALTENRFEGGASPKSDVAQAQTQLDTTMAQETDIDVERAAYEHAIAVLLGKPPAEFTLAPEPLRVEPPVIPVGLPSQLLERRPDIAAAERRTQEANEQIGIARAAFFPTVTLSATGGFDRLDHPPRQLLSAGRSIHDAVDSHGSPAGRYLQKGAALSLSQPALLRWQLAEQGRARTAGLDEIGQFSL